ncbi:hypothetical protein SKAU_G00305130 [Synaphobranchus kaupii]|uniref:Uncharacterized protein n=1 Tax=Synaphobranchus kaupii TaxID=118154 RepID=A0A9Q1EQS8_SYNKA|nr:hypothetical protein SKAU_G00305130 [Synaphobranchus kaupii]
MIGSNSPQEIFIWLHRVAGREKGKNKGKLESGLETGQDWLGQAGNRLDGLNKKTNSGWNKQGGKPGLSEQRNDLAVTGMCVMGFYPFSPCGRFPRWPREGAALLVDACSALL